MDQAKYAALDAMSSYDAVGPALHASQAALPIPAGTVELLPAGGLQHLYGNPVSKRSLGVLADARRGRWCECCRQAVEGAGPVRFEDAHQPASPAPETTFAVTVTPLPVRGPNGGRVCSYVAEETSAAREAEARLRDSEATLSAVLEALPVGVIIADAYGRIVRDNAANRELWGMPPQASNWQEYGEWEAYWPESGRRIAPHEWAMARALLDGAVVRGELVECQPFDGGPRRFYLNNAAPIRDAGGKIVAGVVVELDVTAQRHAQAALLKSSAEGRLAAERVQLALAAGAIVGTWDWDLPSDRFTVDERFAESFGIDPALGRSGLSLEQVIATVHPDDLGGLREAIDAAIRRGGPYSHEYRVRSKDGVYRWIEANGRVDHAPDGTPKRFPGVLLDHERRRAIEAERDRATQLLRAFIDAVPGVVYAKDSDGRMLVANRGVAALVGKPPEDFLGKTDLEFLDNVEQAEAVMANDRRIMYSGQAETVEEEVSFHDGRRAIWLSTKAPFHDDQGRVVGLIGSSVDITERKQAESALLESDRRRNEFLAMLGHELRNPLAPIASAVQLLEIAGDRPERRSAALQIIRRQTVHMARLVDDLLEVARVTQGRIELRKDNLLLASAVFSAVESVRPLVREREQTLQVDVAPDLDLMADQVRLTQILANLLNNASKYTQPGGTIEVHGRAAGEFVEIVVADNGPGIDAELLPRIFDLFSQGATTIDRSRGGLGLGLALVKRLVDLHDGEIRAESAGHGKGAVFTVRLPRAERWQAASTMAPGTAARTVIPTRILAVDDNLDALETLTMLLEADGHEVARAGDGEEALAVARAFGPQVVLLDIGLPKLDGWEVARRLRTDPATGGAVLIALSGYGQASDRERSSEAGFNAHLLKPVDLGKVYETIAANGIRTGAPSTPGSTGGHPGLRSPG